MALHLLPVVLKFDFVGDDNLVPGLILVPSV